MVWPCRRPTWAVTVAVPVAFTEVRVAAASPSAVVVVRGEMTPSVVVKATVVPSATSLAYWSVTWALIRVVAPSTGMSGGCAVTVTV